MDYTQAINYAYNILMQTLVESGAILTGNIEYIPVTDNLFPGYHLVLTAYITYLDGHTGTITVGAF